MPYRKTIFANNEIYHVLNRGVNSVPIFLSRRDYERFLQTIDFLRFNPATRFSHFMRMKQGDKSDFLNELKNTKKPVVDIFVSGIMPNHFHFLMEQLVKNGIQTFMSNLQNSYAKYFNAKHNRKGPLFESAFKSVRIETEEQLKHVSRYIHLNPVSSYIIDSDKLKDYPYTSFGDYCYEKRNDFINTEKVLSLFAGNAKEYENFVLDHAGYQRELEIIKHLTKE